MSRHTQSMFVDIFAVFFFLKLFPDDIWYIYSNWISFIEKRHQKIGGRPSFHPLTGWWEKTIIYNDHHLLQVNLLFYQTHYNLLCIPRFFPRMCLRLYRYCRAKWLNTNSNLLFFHRKHLSTNRLYLKIMTWFYCYFLVSALFHRFARFGFYVSCTIKHRCMFKLVQVYKFLQM